LRIETLCRGLASISLTLALVLSLTFTATPVLAPDVVFEPGGTIVEVPPGGEVVLAFRLRWDEDAQGYYAISIYWDCPENRPEENFTFVGASAYFDNDDAIDATVDLYEGPWDNGTRYSVVVGNATSDTRNGEFNVDLSLRAAGADDVPHIAGDHPIIISGTISVWETTLLDYAAPNPVITVRVLPNPILISPGYQSGPPGSAINYTITIMNFSGVDDTYALTATDTASWGLAISPTSLMIPAGENGTVTLSVTIPLGASIETEDKITITAASTEDPAVSSSSVCEAIASEEAPAPTAWPATLAVLIAVAILAGGYALYSIFKASQRKRKGKRTLSPSAPSSL